MGKKKVRATRTNGRKDSNGVFKAGHNDRSFNLENAEHVDADRSKWNVYWDYLQGYNLADENGVRPERKYLFDEVEYLYYHKQFGDSIDAQNGRHEKSRHTERIRNVRQIMEDSRTCPEETIYQLGTKDGYEDPSVFVKVAAELFEVIQEKYGSHMQILDWALHMDEATPHIHNRRKCHGGTGLRAECVRQSCIFSGKNETAHFQKWYCGRRKSIRKRLFLCRNANGNRACFLKGRIPVPGGKRRKVCRRC